MLRLHVLALLCAAHLQQTCGAFLSHSTAAAVRTLRTGAAVSTEGPTRGSSPVCMAGRPGGRRPRNDWKNPPPKDTTPINEKIAYEEMRVMLDNPAEGDTMLGVMSKAEVMLLS